MDMILGVFTTVFVGVPLTIMCLAMSWWMDERMDNGQPNDDSDVRIYIPSRSGDRIGDNGRDQQMDPEQVINGLQTLRMALSKTEKEWLDYACDCVFRIEQLQKIVEEVKNNDNND